MAANGDGLELGAAFGGGMMDSLAGAQTTNVLQKGTTYLGGTLFVLSGRRLKWSDIRRREHGWIYGEKVGRRVPDTRALRWLSTAATIQYVCFGWVFFASPDLPTALISFQRMF